MRELRKLADARVKLDLTYTALAPLVGLHRSRLVYLLNDPHARCHARTSQRIREFLASAAVKRALVDKRRTMDEATDAVMAEAAREAAR